MADRAPIITVPIAEQIALEYLCLPEYSRICDAEWDSVNRQLILKVASFDPAVPADRDGQTATVVIHNLHHRIRTNVRVRSEFRFYDRNVEQDGLTFPRHWCETHEIRVEPDDTDCAIARRIGEKKRPLECAIVKGTWTIEEIR